MHVSPGSYLVIFIRLADFRIHFMFRILEAMTKLWHMEDVMDVRELRWQLQLIGYRSTTCLDLIGSNVARG